MLKKYKQLFVGIVAGFVLASSVALGEDVIRNAYFNSDLKLAINGQEVEDIRIVTVELEGEQWGRNYYSIADLIKALNDYGGISAKVDFDSATKTTVVEVERKEDVVMATPTPVPETYEEIRDRVISIIEKNRQEEMGNDTKTPSKTNQSKVNRYTQDGLEILEIDGEKYVNSKEVERILREYFDGSILLMPSENKEYLCIADLRPINIGFSDSTKFPEKKPVPKELTDLQIPWYDPLNRGEYYLTYDFVTDNILSQLK